MKLQVITTIVALSGLFTATSADAGKFNLGQAFQTAQQINWAVNGMQQPQYKIYPGYNYGTNLGYIYNPPVWKTTPVYTTPTYTQHVHVYQPPVNRPPVKTFKMVLQNNTGAEVYYSLNHNKNYTTMPKEDVDVFQSYSQKPVLISYHNGHEVVEYELNPASTYSFEWQEDTLQLLEIQG